MSGTGPNQQRQLILNVSPVEFGETDVSCLVLPYEGREQISRLRLEYGSSYAFRRSRDNIYAVPMTTEVMPLEGKPETVALNRDHRLASFLIRTAFVRYLYSIHRPVTAYDRINIIAGSASTNILGTVFPKGIKCPDWLQVQSVFRADVRFFHLDHRTPFVGLTFDLGVVHRIMRSCAELQQDGIDITLLYVGHYKPASDPYLAPHFQLIGRVGKVKDGVCHLIDARDGNDTIATDEAYLEPRYDSLVQCLAHFCNRQTPTVMQALANAEGRQRDGETKLAKLKTMLARFNDAQIQIVPGVTMRFGDFLTEADTHLFPQTSVVPGPIYIFDIGAGKTDTWHERGLRNHRPFSASTFSPTKPRICVICQEKHAGRVEQFVQKLLNGIPAQGDRKSAFEMGLVRMYALDEPIIRIFRANGDTPDAYRNAVREAIAEAGEQGIKWDFALVQIDEHFHELPREHNPYYTTKAMLLGRQITSQEFEIETAESSNYQLQYILNNMALAIYAKLGGTPWLIDCDRSVAHEVVIGMGSAIIGEERFGRKDRVVGITTVFKGDGSYYLANISRATLMASFKDELLNSLRATIRQVQSTMNWQEGDRIRLIFHSFKPMRNDEEAEAVKDAMDDLGMYNVEYAFLHIANDHPYQLFDKSEPGAPAGTLVKGRYAAGKGTLVPLSEEEALLSLIGARDLKRPEDGLPRPVLLRLHKASTFRDLTYLARQAYRFSRHSWRSFFPASLPVTIYYSQLIAKLLGELALVPGWDDNAMLDQIGHTRWYL